MEIHAPMIMKGPNATVVFAVALFVIIKNSEYKATPKIENIAAEISRGVSKEPRTNPVNKKSFTSPAPKPPRAIRYRRKAPTNESEALMIDLVKRWKSP